MNAHAPILILLIPLFGALISQGLGLRWPRASAVTAVSANAMLLIVSLIALLTSLNSNPFHYALGSWVAPYGIELILDPLSAFISAVIGFIALTVLSYGASIIKQQFPERRSSFYCLALILEMGLLGMVMTGDLFNLYVFLEISSLAAYALMAVGNSRAPLSALRYLFLGTIGASFYLLGLGFLYVSTGSLNMADVTLIISQLNLSPPLLVALTLMITGFAMKMALFPMHGWLPNAYTYASAAATALIAPLMTKVSAYVIIRLTFFLFSTAPEGVIHPVTTTIAWLSCGGILIGSIMAMAQKDLKRMLAYSSVSQIAYIGLGIGMASPLGLIGALLHILNHALMKACLFMGSGAVESTHGGTSVAGLRGIGRRMPWTGAAITTACLAMVGVPPTVGFFSKWYLVRAALDANQWIFAAVVLTSSLLTAVYMFRVIELLYLKEIDDTSKYTAKPPKEAPWLMRLPTFIIAIFILLSGLASSWLVSEVLHKVVAHV